MLNIYDDFATITDFLINVIIDGQDVRDVLRRSVTTKEAESSGGKYLSSDTVFHIDAVCYLDRPVIGGRVTDTDGDWTILQVEWQTIVRRWRCTCRQLSIEPSQTVEIQYATYAKGPTGAIEPTWATEADDVVARVEIISESVETDNMNRTTETSAVVYFASPRPLGPAHRIIADDGTVLKVLSWEGFSAIDQLFKAKCEVSKWPQS